MFAPFGNTRAGKNVSMNKENEQPHKSDIATREEEILAWWKEKRIFEKSLEKDAPKGEFVFYDGPPFATGLPHYGHIVPGTAKDVIPRYKTMRGYHVARRWGWDCHGLPIETLIEKELKLGSKKEIEKFGIATFNAAAKKSVMRYADDWRRTIARTGRWVDMDDDYRTMDWQYTESVWWAFSELYKKGLIYEGVRPMHVCPRCETPLSNFEVSQGYADVTDIAVTVKFPLVGVPDTFFLAWTTTPWTLPGNAALAVNPELTYVTFTLPEGAEKYIVAEALLARVAPQGTIVEKRTGREIVGIAYQPPFSYFTNADLPRKENAWKVYAADFVTANDGTGIVHIAPSFGEDDMALAQKNGIPFITHVAPNGFFTKEVVDFPGQAVKTKENPRQTDELIAQFLTGKNLLFKKEDLPHTYPHCWRCETPLLNYVADSWFVNVQKLKKALIGANKSVRWIPSDVRDGRFGKWLEGARDWSISRARFWGAPIPVWKCDSCKSIEVVGSLEELKNKNGKRTVFYLMRHAEAESNVRGVVSSVAENPHHLTEKGKEQARDAAKNKLSLLGIDRIVSSPFPRARETADIAAQELECPVYFDDRIGEINTGEFNLRPVLEYWNYFASQKEKFTKRPQGGENLLDVQKRVMAFLNEMAEDHPGETILVVSHESPLWMMEAGIKGLDIDGAAAMRRENIDLIGNAEVHKAFYDPLPHNESFETDLHRPFIDAIVFPCECGGKFRRIPDVFDCWFESGSMPFAQFHYPFTRSQFNQEKGVGFPADFIAEGIDQTRGWFYSLLVISIGLFGTAPYKAIVASGLVLAEDGKKMSKRLKNYPEVEYMLDRYGADALRFYLLSSPVIRGEELRFSETGVKEVLNKVVMRLKNVASFYVLYTPEGSVQEFSDSSHVLDRFILARLRAVVETVTDAFESYELDRAPSPLEDFIDDLSTWYLRRSRERFKSKDTDDAARVRAVMRHVLRELAKIMAPITPFLAEDVYGMVRGTGNPESVHLAKWPEYETYLKKDEELISAMKSVRNIVSLALEARAKANIKVRQPLARLSVNDAVVRSAELAQLIKDEVNVKEVIFSADIVGVVALDTTVTPELKKEGNLRDIVRLIQEMRKQKGLKPGEKVVLSAGADEDGGKFLEEMKEELMRVAALSDIEIKVSGGGETAEVGGMKFQFAFS